MIEIYATYGDVVGAPAVIVNAVIVTSDDSRADSLRVRFATGRTRVENLACSGSVAVALGIVPTYEFPIELTVPDCTTGPTRHLTLRGPLDPVGEPFELCGAIVGLPPSPACTQALEHLAETRRQMEEMCRGLHHANQDAAIIGTLLAGATAAFIAAAAGGVAAAASVSPWGAVVAAILLVVAIIAAFLVHVFSMMLVEALSRASWFRSALETARLAFRSGLARVRRGCCASRFTETEVTEPQCEGV